MLNDQIRAAAKIEADRQGCDEKGYERLLSAYDYSWNFAKGKTRRPFLKWLIETAWLLEEDKNRNGFRVTPVTFQNGGSSADPSRVPVLTTSLFQWMNEDFEVGAWNDEATEQFISEFLWIHPFADGNGRLAFIMRVWLRNEWTNPSALPNYFA